MTKIQKAAIEALARDGKEAVTGKGGFHIKGEGFVKAATVYRRYGLKSGRATKRERVQPYGDYAWLAAINGLLAFTGVMLGVGFLLGRARA